MHARRVPPRLPALVDRIPHLRREVRRVHDVLDGQRHAVDRRKRLAVAITRGRGIRRGARSVQPERHECMDLGLARRQGRDTALEIRPRVVLPRKERLACLVEVEGVGAAVHVLSGRQLTHLNHR
jgi:hypothetical protein